MPTRASQYQEKPKLIFDDVEFELGMDSVTMSDNANINARVIPGTNRSVVQQLGNSPTTFGVQAFLLDNEQGVNTDRALSIHNLLRTADVVDFVHPYHGRFRVRISGLQSKQDHNTGETKMNFSLIVVQETAPVRVRMLPGDALRGRGDNLVGAYGNQFVEAYKPPTSESETTSIVGQVRNFTDEVVDNVITPSGEGLFLWNRFRAVSEPVLSLTEETIDLIQDGTRFASETQQLFGYVGNANNPAGLLRALSYIHNRYTLRGDGFFTSLLRGLGIARQLNILGSTPLREIFPRRRDAEVYTNDLIDNITDEMGDSPENVNELKETIDEVYAYIDDQLPDIYNVKNGVLTSAVPRVVIAHREYGDKDRFEDVRHEGDFGLIVKRYEVDVR